MLNIVVIALLISAAISLFSGIGLILQGLFLLTMKIFIGIGNIGAKKTNADARKQRIQDEYNIIENLKRKAR